MENYYKEKRIYVLELKLKKIENELQILRRSLFKAFLGIIGISLYVSLFGDVYEHKIVKEITQGVFFYEILFTFSICAISYLLGYFIWQHQDKRKIKKLKKEIEILRKI